ncbi:hypothetical protein OAF63_00780 [Saprospiraceae bacterium]|jgi:hypothetical protein|nr:hypothetical protein [Bacteroidota bacterium]MDB4727297.1 hypothetical protein [Saprospiraceae bacterium]
MKRIFNFLLFSMPLLLLAQTPFKIQVETRSGYEYNVFNASKNKWKVIDDDSIPAIQSGFFQHFNIKNKWEKEIENHLFLVGLKTSFDYFPSLEEANLFRPELNLKYQYELNKKSSLFFRGKLSKYQTNRFNDDEGFSMPTSYAWLGADFGYKIEPFKYNRTQIKLSAYEKQFEPSEMRNLKYSAFRINLLTTQRFKKAKRLYHYLSFELDFARRNYMDSFFELDEEEPEEEIFYEDSRERIWQYSTLDLSYKHSFSREARLKMGLSLQKREDILDEQFGYNQWKPYLKFSVKKEKLEVSANLESVFRFFTHIEATEDGNELLIHKYLRTSVLLKYNFSEQLGLTLRGSMVIRQRNLMENAKNYLPYTNGLISLGIKYQF